MSNIEENLAFILRSRYGGDVRQAIHDAIHDCYEDGKAGATDLIAREQIAYTDEKLSAQIANLVANEGTTEKDSELIDVRVGFDGYTYPSAGDAVRSQAENLADDIDAIAVFGYKSLDVEFTDGEYIPYFNKDKVISNISAKYVKISCKRGEKYKIKTQNFYEARGYAVFSSLEKGAIMYYRESNMDIISEEITIPDDGVLLVISSYTSYQPVIEKLLPINKDYYAKEKDFTELYLSFVPVYDNFYNNLINLAGRSVIKDKALNFQIGAKYSLVESEGYYTVKNLLPVKEGEEYTCFPKYARAVVYNSDLIVIDSLYDGISESLHYIMPENSAYLGLFWTNNKPFGIFRGNILNPGYVSPDIFSGKSSAINNLTWCAFGDSLTDPNTLQNEDSGTKNYVDFVRFATGLRVINLGKGGSGYMADNNYNQSFVDRITDIPPDVDIITCFGSFNDYTKANMNIGDISDTTEDTLYGCLNKFVNDVHEQCPDAILALISPTPWSSYNNVSGNSDFAETYVKAISDISKKYGLPFLDLYHISGLRPWDTSFKEEYFKDDTGDGIAEGIHPLEKAHKKYIAPKVESFIKTIISTYSEYDIIDN